MKGLAVSKGRRDVPRPAGANEPVMCAGRFADHVPTTTLAIPDRHWSTVTVVTPYFRGRDLLPLGEVAAVTLTQGGGVQSVLPLHDTGDLKRRYVQERGTIGDQTLPHSRRLHGPFER